MYGKDSQDACLLTKTQSAEYSVGGYRPTSNVVQSYVKGERTDFVHSSGGPVATAEPSFTDRADSAEEIVLGNVNPTPTAEQRRFSAPHNEWDATR